MQPAGTISFIYVKPKQLPEDFLLVELNGSICESNSLPLGVGASESSWKRFLKRATKTSDWPKSDVTRVPYGRKASVFYSDLPAFTNHKQQAIISVEKYVSLIINTFLYFSNN